MIFDRIKEHDYKVFDKNIHQLAMPETAYYSRNYPRKCIGTVLEEDWGGIGVDSKLDMIDCPKLLIKVLFHVI